MMLYPSATTKPPKCPLRPIQQIFPMVKPSSTTITHSKAV